MKTLSFRWRIRRPCGDSRRAGLPRLLRHLTVEKFCARCRLARSAFQWSAWRGVRRLPRAFTLPISRHISTSKQRRRARSASSFEAPHRGVSVLHSVLHQNRKRKKRRIMGLIGQSTISRWHAETHKAKIGGVWRRQRTRRGPGVLVVGGAFGPLPLGFAMNIAFARKSPIACVGVVRCETRLPPNEGGNATLFAGVRFESGPGRRLVQHGLSNSP